MRLTLTADLHGSLPELRDECDVLVIAGDICPDFLRSYRRGTQAREHKGAPEQMKWLKERFIPWVNLLRAERVIIIPGNHDFVFQAAENGVRELLDNYGVDYLRDEALSIGAVKFYGTPWVPNLPFWAFYGDEHKLETVFARVPDDTDILITHGPPKGYGDLTEDNLYGPGDHVGSWDCRAAIDRVQPQIVVTGHIHEAYGHYRAGNTDIYNVSLNTVRYQPINDPVEVVL